jgi:hypothetical protein
LFRLQPEIVAREFNEEVQHLEGLAFSWYSRWLWEKDTGILALRNGTG